MTDNSPHFVDKVLADFCSEMNWATERSEADKMLILGNLRSFAGRLKSGLLNEEHARRVLTDACKAAGGQSAWAKLNHVSPQYVCDVVQGRRDPGVAICSALGMKRVVSYCPVSPVLEQSR